LILTVQFVAARMGHSPAKRVELVGLEVARIGAGFDGANPAVRADLHAPPRYFRDSNIKNLESSVCFQGFGSSGETFIKREAKVSRFARRFRRGPGNIVNEMWDI
jgi:hypothetical protein